jgi:hypothetical protein
MIPFFHLQIIETKADLRSVDESLEDLPVGLSQLYKLVLDLIRERTGDAADSGLQIVETVLCAARRLRPNELQHALATCKGDSNFNKLGCPVMGKILAGRSYLN